MPSNSYALVIHSYYLKVEQRNVLDARSMWRETWNIDRCPKLWVESICRWFRKHENSCYPIVFWTWCYYFYLHWLYT